MGTEYYIICDDCKQYYCAGKDSEISNSFRMAFDLICFLMEHSYHKVGCEEDGSFVGDEKWYEYDEMIREDIIEGWIVEKDTRAFKEDFKERHS